jgi:hypothetical protein
VLAFVLRLRGGNGAAGPTEPPEVHDEP